MKRNQVNNMFNKDKQRKKNIIIYIVVISIMFVLSLSFLFIYVTGKKLRYVKYSEDSHVNYEVYLKNNSFYKEKTIDENNQYISELINYINAQFEHTISLERNDLNYNYSYYIEARAVVSDKKTHKNVYEYSEELVSSRTITSDGATSLISENVVIDYNKYNELISKFVQTYKLDETENVLKINLVVKMDDSCNENSLKNVSDSITTLEIPLTQRTISIDVLSNLVGDDDNIMLCIQPSSFNYIYGIISLVLCLIAIFLAIKMVLYIIKTRTAKSVYDKELKRILSNYRSYIQKVNSRFSFADYQTLRVDNFTDMLEIRDTTNQPILMIENSGKDSVYFVIPTATKILYIYNIKVSDIEKEMSNKDN